MTSERRIEANQAAREGKAVPLPEVVETEISVSDRGEVPMALLSKNTDFSGAEIKTLADPAQT